MPVYMLVEAVEVLDKEKYASYVQKVPATLQKFGGRYLVRGTDITTISGTWHPKRLIIVEFDSMERLRAWYDSPDYRAIASLREQGAKTNAVVVEGIGT
jgi:uncharacterized protein (DUF1330 family)